MLSAPQPRGALTVLVGQQTLCELLFENAHGWAAPLKGERWVSGFADWKNGLRGVISRPTLSFMGIDLVLETHVE